MKAVLALGSNFGDRLTYIKRTIRALALNAKSDLPLSPLSSEARIEILTISPIYESDALLPEGAPAEWNRPFFNLVLLCETNLNPHELLNFIKQIERKIGRQPRGRWSPREIDIDILAMGDLVVKSDSLEIPHNGLKNRPFFLMPFADLMPEWRYPVRDSDYGKCIKELAFACKSPPLSETPLNTRRSAFCFTEFVGILNITPDSFSDGGLYHSPNAALQLVDNLIQNGIRIIDLGGESTRPKATALHPAEEWQRIESVIHSIIEICTHSDESIKLSIDTRHPEVATRALQAGVHWINDVTGFSNPQMCAVAAESEAQLVVMHSLSIPPEKELTLPQDLNPIDELLKWGQRKIRELERFGISRDRIIFDPGLGFGKTFAQSWQILREIQKFRDLGVQILVGHSRKSFLSTITEHPPTKRDIETITLSLDLIQKGIDYLRIHDGENHKQAVKAWTQVNGMSQWRI